MTGHFLCSTTPSPPPPHFTLLARSFVLASDSRDGFLCKNHETAVRGRESRQKFLASGQSGRSAGRSRSPFRISHGMHCRIEEGRKGGRTRQLVSCPFRGLACFACSDFLLLPFQLPHPTSPPCACLLLLWSDNLLSHSARMTYRQLVVIHHPKTMRVEGGRDSGLF